MRGDDQAGGGLGLTPEVARFLRAHPPFDALDPAAVARVAAAVELERFTAGETIFAQGESPVQHLRVVREGEVELTVDGQVLEVMGEGELFGQASMLSGRETGFAARAAAPTLCYRVGHALAEQVLAEPAGLRYVARSLVAPLTDLHVLARTAGANVADEPVATLLRGGPVLCEPHTTVREAAILMGEGAASAVVVDLGERGWGIVTDGDLRETIADGRSGDAPVQEIMSAPAHTCGAERPAGEVLLEMLDRGLRHVPVLSARGELLGVLDDMDIVAARTRSSFYLRRRIAGAGDVDELAAVARELGPMAASLHEAHVAAANVMAVYAVCVDALTRRLLALAPGRPAVEFAWLAMGSQARREALPGSDVDSAIVWFGDDDGGDGDAIRDELAAVGTDVLAGLQRCGLRTDEHGVNASDRRFVRSVDAWQQLAHGWLADPTQDKALVLSATVIDSRPVWGVHTGTPVADAFCNAPDHPGLLYLLGRFALAQRPPSGWLRARVPGRRGGEASGGRLDLKHGGTLPIVALARWAAMSSGVTIASTPERLRAAAGAGTLSDSDAHSLTDAFELINDLRLGHQVDQIRTGRAPDDLLAPDECSALMRTQLRQVFRLVSEIQRHVANELRLGAR